MKFLLTILLLLCCVCGAYAQSESSTVSSLVLNESEYCDIEVFMDSSNRVFVPVKQTSKILEIPVTINHSSKEIRFLTYSGKEVLVSKEGVFMNGVKILSSPIFQKEGILGSDEYFIDKTTASKIFESDVDVDSNSLSVRVENKHLITLTGKGGESVEEQKEILKPKPKGRVSFDTFEVNNSMMSDSTKQVYLNTAQNNVMFNNNTRMGLKGKICGGDYALNFNTNNYTQELFSFGGLSFSYRNKIKDFFYELGQVSGLRDDYNSIGTMLIGAQLSDYDDYEKKKDNQTEEKIFLEKGDVQHRIFAGVSGYNNRLFSSNGYIYQMNSKKLVGGINRRYGIKNDMTLDTKVVFDKIIRKNDDAIFITNLYNDYSLLSSGVYRNPNTMEGLSIINTLNLYKNKNYHLNLLGGVSASRDFNYNNGEYSPGYSLSLENIFDYKNYTFKLRLYQQSPDYYVAGSDSGFISDRIGAEIGANYSRENLNANMRYTRYYSNLDKRYRGGLTSFDELYFNSGMKIFNLARARLNGNLRYGENGIGDNLNYYYNFNLSRSFRQRLSLEAGYMNNAYNTEYSDNNSFNSGFKSSYDTAYMSANYRLPKNKGVLTLGHDNVSYESGGASNNYNMIKLNYRFPEFKRVLIGFGIGYKYSGLDGGCTYSGALGYRTKSGMIMSVNYQYNTAMGYIFNNMYIPSNARHSINFTLNDTFAFSQNGLQSIGSSSPNQGFVEIVAYIDKNKNGKFDKEDIKVSNVPVSVSWQNESIKTKRSGFCPLQCVEKGIYEVKLDGENMHTNLSAEKNAEANICVEPQKTTRVEFPLRSSVGNISGILKISDDFDRKMNISDFIVTLCDEDGAEVAYSTVDEEGSYYFSGISPGKYVIALDKNFVNDYNLMPDEKYGKIEVDIPYVYKEFVELNNQNLVYKSY